MRVIFRMLILTLPLLYDSVEAQVAGDFQTRTAMGSWSMFSSWNVFTGSSWVAAISGQVPGPSNSVFVQAGHTISVDNGSAVCNDLNIINASGGNVSYLTSTSILNVKGSLSLTTTANCFATWVSGAKLIFSGSGDQNMPNNLGTYSVLDLVEVNKVSGTLTSGNSFKFNKFILTAGNFDVLSGADVRGNTTSATITITGGTWSQIGSATKISASSAAIGAVTIAGGSMILQTSSGSPGFMFSSIDVSNGGNLTLNKSAGNFSISNSLTVDGTSTLNVGLTNLALPASVAFNGVVNFNDLGAQTIPSAIYSYLKLSGSGTKTLGGNITIPANGTLEMSGTISAPTLALAGNSVTVFRTGTSLIYSSSASQTASANEWDQNFQNVDINSGATVSMAGLARSISGSLTLTKGTLDIGANGALTLAGASLIRTAGYVKGTSSSDLTVSGTTGGTVLLPFPGNTAFRNVTVTGSRTLSLDGVNNLDLYGSLDIGASAAFDNGGESQLAKGASAPATIIITGKFVNRDKDNFSGTNGAIPGIVPTLNAGCTIEYALAGNQLVTPRTDYKNITFSGSGVKTAGSSFTPSGTLSITGSAVLDATGHNIGDGTSVTDFTMIGGRIILGTLGTQPMMGGTYNLTNGVVEFAGSGATAQTIRSLKTYNAIEVTGNNVGNSSGNITLAANGTFTVKSGGTFTINSDAIEGPSGIQTVTVENGGTFRSGNNDGFHGYASTFSNYSSLHQNIENINLLPGSTVEYTRSGDQPITTANGLVYQNLSISGSGNKTAPAGVLTVQGNLLKSGTSVFKHNNGTVLLNGSSAQSFAGLPYNNLILSNGIKSTNGNSTIIDSIKVNAGATLSLSDNDVITLHSDAVKTARVGQLNGTITYGTNAKFSVERFISARRAWRFLSVPTKNSFETIKTAWQEGALTSSSNPNSGYGTQIIDNNVNWSANGFDALAAGGPSVKTYDPGTDSYSGIASTYNAFDPSLGGYMVFIRGDRTATTLGSPATSTVLRTSGELITGDQPVINISPGEIIPINNPFASAIDLRKLSSYNNVAYYVWDPNRGGGYGLGAFQTLTANGTGFDVVPGSGSYGSTNDFIENGQAFFAGTSGPATTIQLTENTKTDVPFPVSPFVPMTDLNPRLRTNLFFLNDDGTTLLADGVLQNFSQDFNDGIDGLDAKKIFNSGENLSIKTNGQLIVVERRNVPRAKDSIYFSLSGLSIRNYRLEFGFNAMTHAGVEAYLEDAYLKTRTLLSPTNITRYDFPVTNEAASRDAARFKIVFEAASGALPLTFTGLKAFTKGFDVAVEWIVENENGVHHFEVERSRDGINFTGLGSLTAANNPAGNYSYIDPAPSAGNIYYRIKSVDMDGSIKYSKVVKVFLATGGQTLTVYPNPIQHGVIHLEINNAQTGIYQFRLFTQTGQLIFDKQLNHSRGLAGEKIDLKPTLIRGIYNLEITLPDKNKVIRKVIY